MVQGFDEAFRAFYEEQKEGASARRLEMLQSDMTGEIRLLREVIWPVFGSFDGFTLEYEMESINKVKIFADVFYEPLRLVFECDGYVVHAEKITRKRFDFERMRMRTFALNGYKYIPFSWDELDRNPSDCRRTVYELLGRYSGTDDRAYRELSVHEREVIRYALRLNRPFRMADVCYCLNLAAEACRKVLRGLMDKGLIQAKGLGREKIRFYELTERARDYML